ncbi:MAG: SRPBCC domain-containing protein [Myxococcota bacterium]
MSHATRLSVTLTREYDAPIELVYAAWTDAAHVSQWMKCDDAAVLECTKWEPKVGATYETTMEMPGMWKVRNTGRFTEVDPPRLLVYVSDPTAEPQMPEMEVRVELEAIDGGRTRLTLTHSGMPSEDLCGTIEGGWTHSLEALVERFPAADFGESRTV